MVITKGFFSKTYECPFCEKKFKDFTEAKEHEDRCPQVFDAGVFNLEDHLKETAEKHEKLMEYDEAAEIYKELGIDDDVIRVRKLKAEQGSVKITQKVVHGDEVTKTEIKDSVLNKSNVGGGNSKMKELKDLAEMKKEGLISDKEYVKMKQEIIG